MLINSFRLFMESAVHAEDLSENLSGHISDFNEFLMPTNLVKINSSFRGVFAFLAFHPIGDKAISDYLLSGTIASDSGKEVLMFFLANRDARWARPLTSNDLIAGGSIDPLNDPPAEFVQMLFKDGQPPLPGVVFFEKFALTEPIFVTLRGLKESDQIRERIQDVCALAGKSFRECKASGGLSFTAHFSRSLAKGNIKYNRTGQQSCAEAFFKFAHSVLAHGNDIVNVISLFK